MVRKFGWLLASFLVLVASSLLWSTYFTVVADSGRIEAKLASFSTAPTIITGNYDLPVELYDQTLVISHLDPATLEKISPILAKLMVQKYFPDSPNKPLPVVKIVDSLPNHDLGHFSPTTQIITLAVDPKSPPDVITYLETLNHEYLHYISYNSNKSLPLPIEEGLTEYYARQVTLANLHQDTNIGYPILTGVIAQLAIKIPAQDLQSIYFSKDQIQLQNVLDLAQGKNFYTNSSPYFNLLLNSSSDKSVIYADRILHMSKLD